MQTFLDFLLEARQEPIPTGVMQGYELAFRDELVQLIQRTKNPALKAHFEAMLDCPIKDSRGGCRSFSDYILSALIRNGIHKRYDLEAALGYVVEKMLMPVGEDGSPRATLFGSFEERPDQTPDFNPLQARFLKHLQFAIQNIRSGKIPRLANTEARPQGTVSIGQGRGQGDLEQGVSPDDIPARASTEKDLNDLVWDIKMLLRQKERSLDLPLEQLFLAIMQGMNTEEQRKTFGDRTARIARRAIIQTIKSYAERTGNYMLLNMLQRFEGGEANSPVPAKRQPVKVARPVLTDQQRDYSSIINVLDKLGRSAGSADFGRYRRRWLEYPPRDPTSGYQNRLAEVLAAMVQDGVLRVTTSTGGASYYSLGPNANQYRPAGVASATS